MKSWRVFVAVGFGDLETEVGSAVEERDFGEFPASFGGEAEAGLERGLKGIGKDRRAGVPAPHELRLRFGHDGAFSS